MDGSSTSSAGILPLSNPFNAPVYYRETVDTTMDEARLLDKESAVHGTVIAADYQRRGRGRSGRLWQAAQGKNLIFTVILKYPAIETIPPCLTLKAGLAVSYAIESFALLFKGALPHNAVQIKWPNDIMLIQQDGSGKKTSGILAETSGGNVYLGIGINIAQCSFPSGLTDKACSIAASFGIEPALLEEKRFVLLEMVLSRLKAELETTELEATTDQWREQLEARLFMKGLPVRFIPGIPSETTHHAEAPVTGTLQGIGDRGELLVASGGRTLSFITGELQVYAEAIPAAVRER